MELRYAVKCGTFSMVLFCFRGVRIPNHLARSFLPNPFVELPDGGGPRAPNVKVRGSVCLVSLNSGETFV